MPQRGSGVTVSNPSPEKDHAMPRVSTRRRITLPAEQCRELGIGPGHEYRSYVADGRITIVRKTAGAARGALRYVPGDPAVSDEDALEDTPRSGCALRLQPKLTGSKVMA